MIEKKLIQKISDYQEQYSHLSTDHIEALVRRTVFFVENSLDPKHRFSDTPQKQLSAIEAIKEFQKIDLDASDRRKLPQPMLNLYFLSRGNERAIERIFEHWDLPEVDTVEDYSNLAKEIAMTEAPLIMNEVINSMTYVERYTDTNSRKSPLERDSLTNSIEDILEKGSRRDQPQLRSSASSSLEH